VLTFRNVGAQNIGISLMKSYKKFSYGTRNNKNLVMGNILTIIRNLFEDVLNEILLKLTLLIYLKKQRNFNTVCIALILALSKIYLVKKANMNLSVFLSV
jgi:hypothetical protein